MNSQNLIAELEFELISTTRLLELVPAEKLNWQPHPKAMTLGELANHVASIPGRYLGFAEEGTTTLQTLGEHAAPKSKNEILQNLAASNAKAKESLSSIDEKWLSRTWNLTKNGSVVFTLSLPLFTRLLVFNHWCHHRGQLSTYLRTLNVPMPAIYGFSADENPFA